MRADFPVLLDANVLAEASVSDLFLRLSEEPRLLLPRWTDEIWDEVRRTWVGQLDWPVEIADRRIAAATACFPEALITGYERFLPLCENHPKDRHVLAAAISSGTETIVTFNVRDYPAETLAPFGIQARHPAEYLTILFDHDPAAVTHALHAMATKANRSVPELLARLAWSAGAFSRYVAKELALDLPDIRPRDWRR